MDERKPQEAVEYERYTVAYRRAEASQVMSWIRAGQSGCLIGLRGAGKSNFLRFLLHDDGRQIYLGQGSADFALVHVDLLALTECATWAFYELMVERLAAQLRAAGAEPPVMKEIAAEQRVITRTKDSLMAQRAVEQCLNVACQRSGQIALIFDEFDAVFRALDPSVFRSLRAMRDAHKGQVSYLIVVSDELPFLRDDLTEVEHFCRLVSRNVCSLGPYTDADARQMITHLAAQRSIELSGEDIVRLIELSGGHAGLLKTMLSLRGTAPAESDRRSDNMSLKDDPAVRAECQKVWHSLSESEQVGLCAVVSSAPVEASTLRRLKLKGLVRASGPHSATLFSPLFADFCRQQMQPAQERVVVDRALGMALVDGQRVELTELEFEILGYLYDRRGHVCTKDELIANVYHQQYARTEGGMDDARLQTLISRLRSKVEPPRYILTIRGEGYKFVEPGGR